MAEKILVSGASGFIGKALIKGLISDGYDIYALASSPKNVPLEFLAKQKVKFDFVDFKGKVDLHKLPFQIDYVVHLSGVFYEREHIPHYFLVNTLSTLHLLEYAKRAKAKGFILASTGGVYGYHEDKITEVTPPNPFDFLTLSKYQAEMLVSQYEKYFSTAILRLFFPYGPGQKNGLVASLIRKIDIYDEIKVFNKENPKLSPIYIDDLVEVFKRVLKIGGKQILNVAGEEVVSVLELCQMIAQLLKKEPKIVVETDPSIKNLIGDNSQMKQILGYVPTINLEAGLKRTLNL